MGLLYYSKPLSDNQVRVALATLAAKAAKRQFTWLASYYRSKY